jgi:hypothetical protein
MVTIPRAAIVPGDDTRETLTARPTRIPATIATEPILHAPLRNDPQYELCVSKITVPLNARMVEFVGDWEEGVIPFSPPA